MLGSHKRTRSCAVIVCRKSALRKLERPKWLCHGLQSLRSPRRKALAVRPELQAAAL